MKNLVHAKRHNAQKAKNNNQAYTGYASVPSRFEVALKWIPIAAERISPKENKAVYAEYNEVRSALLRATVYNEDGSENKEGISRLRQAGLSDNDIYDTIGQKGMTPNGYNYHHLFPRALSGAMKRGPVKFGNDTLTTVHDWRALMPLPNAIHANVHKAMEQRNGQIPQTPGKKMKYFVAVPLSAEEYEKYKTNPASLDVDLLIVSSTSYRTVQAGKANNIALAKKMAGLSR